MTYKGKSVGFIIGAVIADIGIMFLFALFLMLLWDIAIVEMFNMPEISYSNAICLYVMSNILFGGYKNK